MKIRVENITPVKAAEYLKTNNTNYRKIRKGWIKKLTAMMLNGTFVVNGDPIRFSRDKLIDGQHRLHAILISGLSQEIPVIRELDENAFQTIDRGVKRRLADTLTNQGFSCSSQLAATLHFVFYYSIGGYYHSNDIRQIGIGVTDENMLLFLEKHPSIYKAGEKLRGPSKELNRIISTSMIIAWHFLSTLAGMKSTDEYWIEFCLNDGLRKGTGRHALRDKMVRDSVSTNRKVLQRGYKFYAGIITISKDLDGGSINNIRFPYETPTLKGVSKTQLLTEFGLSE